MNNQIFIKVIKEKSPEEIAKKLQDTTNELKGFATPIIQDLSSHEWIAFIYYRKLNGSDENSLLPLISSKKNMGYSGNKFIPTTEQLDRWKKQQVTDKTISLLEKKGLTNQEIKELKNQYILLESLKNENI